jgi:hypothetical protein
MKNKPKLDLSDAELDLVASCASAYLSDTDPDELNEMGKARGLTRAQTNALVKKLNKHAES